MTTESAPIETAAAPAAPAAPAVEPPPPAASPALPPELAALVPRKFLAEEGGGLRVDALLKSYLELEKRLSTARPQPPEKPDGYAIACDHGLFGADPEINARLHQGGFTQEQAQLLYDLAAERLMPLLSEMAAEMESERELERLVGHFGGADAWQETARQIEAWAGRNLPKEAVEALSGTADGVMALHRMMAAAEPAPLAGGSAASGAEDLRRLVADPRYWRDRDPGFVSRVTEGFRRAYGG